MNSKKLAGRIDRLGRSTRFCFDQYFKDMPLTGSQALVLKYILERFREQDVFTRDIEKAFGVRNPSAISLINGLVKNKLIVRVPSGFDSRFKRLVPTERGIALYDDICTAIDTYIESIFGNISKKELKTFDTVLKKIENNIQNLKT